MTTATITPTWETIAACEPRAAALEVLVQRVTKSVTDDETRWCANAFFGTAIKPFVVALIGWHRGYPPEEALDPTTTPNLIVLNRSRLAALADSEDELRRPVTNPYEQMLRTSDAYDIAYQHLYEPLPGCRDCLCM